MSWFACTERVGSGGARHWNAAAFVVVGLAVCVAAGCSASPTGQSSVVRPGGDGSSATAPSPSAVATTQEPTRSRPSTDEAIAAAKRLIAENSASVNVASVEDVKMARDTRGRWWVSAVGVAAESAHLDPIAVYLYREGSQWKLFDLGTGIDPSELPADVRGGL